MSIDPARQPSGLVVAGPSSSSRKLQARRLSSAPKSAKGKGKEREFEAVQADEPGESSTRNASSLPDEAEEAGRGVTVRFTGGQDAEADLNVWIEARESVGRVKDKIRVLRPSINAYTLRLIHSGRLLTDGILLLPWLRSLEDRHRRQAQGVSGDVDEVLRDVGLTEQAPSVVDVAKEAQEKIWLHCVLGTAPAESQAAVAPASEDNDTVLATERRRGFDALLDAGLTPDEVAQMRRQFYASRGEEVPDRLDELASADDEHARALEEQWIEGDLTADTATTTGEGLYTATLQGLLSGFLFPLMPFCFFREAPVPDFFHPLEAEAEVNDSNGNRLPFMVRGRQAGEFVVGVVFGPRMQGAILLGTVLNLGFGALRFLS